MAKYRTDLPQLAQSTFMTDGGLETTLAPRHVPQGMSKL